MALSNEEILKYWYWYLPCGSPIKYLHKQKGFYCHHLKIVNISLPRWLLRAQQFAVVVLFSLPVIIINSVTVHSLINAQSSPSYKLGYYPTLLLVNTPGPPLSSSPWSWSIPGLESNRNFPKHEQGTLAQPVLTVTNNAIFSVLMIDDWKREPSCSQNDQDQRVRIESNWLRSLKIANLLRLYKLAQGDISAFFVSVLWECGGREGQLDILVCRRMEIISQDWLHSSLINSTSLRFTVKSTERRIENNKGKTRSEGNVCHME